MKDFYTDTLHRLLEQKLIHRTMNILVLCGGKRDQETLARLGFQHVTISNLDTRMTGNEFAPYAWSFQDAENIAFPDGAFDFCLVHDGLHHCASPHRALLEMYRVARIGLLIFEPYDSLTTRLGVRLNFGQDYEAAAVFGNNCTFGGVKNTEVPNYVYRFTERELEKVINTNTPWGRHRFVFFHQLVVPWTRFRMLKNKLWLVLLVLALPFLKIFTLLFPKQGNNFAFAAFKPRIPEDLHPWITERDGKITVNKAWLDERYG